MKVSPRVALERTFSLLEVAIASALFSVLILATAQVIVVLERGNLTVATQSLLDETGRKILTQLRRDIRQTGMQGDTDQVSVPATPSLAATTGRRLVFRVRTGLGSDPAADWSPLVRYVLVSEGQLENAAGTPALFRLERRTRVNGRPLRVVVAHNVEALTYQRDVGSNSILVSLTVVARDPVWIGSQPPEPLRRTFSERIRMMN